LPGLMTNVSVIGGEDLIDELPAGWTSHFDASRQQDLFSNYVIGGPFTGVPGHGDFVGAWIHAQGEDMVWKAVGSNPTATLEQDSVMGQQSLNWDIGATSGDHTMMRLSTYGGTGVPLSALITASAYTLYIAFRPNAITSTNYDYGGHPLIGDTAGYWGVFLASVSGVPKIFAYNYVGIAYYTPAVNCGVGAPHVVCVRHEGGYLYLSIDGGADVSVATGNTAVLTGIPNIGYGVYGSGQLDARVGEILIYDTAHSADERTAAINFLMAKWIP
jgi:hypothetical protein